MKFAAIKNLSVVILIMASLNMLKGSNSQLSISVADVPEHIITMMENMTATATLTFDSQTRMEDILDDTKNTQSQMANALTQLVESQTRIEDTLGQITDTLSQMVNLMQMQSEQLRNTTVAMTNMNGQLNTQRLISPQDIPRDCSDLASRGPYPSGSYTIRPWDDMGNLRVYCDMDTDNDGWTVFQRRFDGSVEFYRRWDAYEEGFGSPDGEHWMGLRQIHRLTRQGTWMLRIDLQDFENSTSFARYGSFSVGDAESYYQLSLSSYSGTAGDSMASHNNQGFSTMDQDHDASGDNCANSYQGSWWYNACYQSNLNGMYLGKSEVNDKGMVWYHWKDSFEVLKRSEMKMRRIK